MPPPFFCVSATMRGDRLAVAERDVAARAVDRELPGEVVQQPAAVGGEQVLELVDAARTSGRRAARRWHRRRGRA